MTNDERHRFVWGGRGTGKTWTIHDSLFENVPIKDLQKLIDSTPKGAVVGHRMPTVHKMWRWHSVQMKFMEEKAQRVLWWGGHRDNG